ncbi:MAG TPA: cell division protein SepF [Candidatus Pacearchaeota archaeon]|nr:cell division protein SepF [Candidatus Pacearchaeota archaeon]
MVRIFKRIFGKEQEETEEYIPVELSKEEKQKKLIVKPFILNSFEDTNKILEVLREGYAIAVIDIKPLKQKDIIELKRAISKLKKTVQALEGDIAGFGENTIIAAPSFVEIARS